MGAIAAVTPCGSFDGLVKTQKMQTAASRANCTNRRSRASTTLRRPEAGAINQTAESARTKTGMASNCARFVGPPRTMAAAATTKLPVMCAVKILPRVKKPVRSTIPAMTLSRGGSRSANRASSVASSAARTAIPAAPRLKSEVGMDVRPQDCICLSIVEAVNEHLWNNEAKTHRQYDDDCRHAVRECRAHQLQRRMRDAGKLHQAAGHSENVDAGHQGHDGGETDCRKRHVPAPRDRGQDQPDEEACHEGTGRDAHAEDGEHHPPHSMGQHPNPHRPREHIQRRGEKDAVSKNGEAGGDDVLP